MKPSNIPSVTAPVEQDYDQDMVPSVQDQSIQIGRVKLLEDLEVRESARRLCIRKPDLQERFNEIDNIPRENAFKYKVFAQAILKPQLEEAGSDFDAVVAVLTNVINSAEGETSEEKNAYFLANILPNIKDVLIGWMQKTVKFDEFKTILNQYADNPCLQEMIALMLTCALDEMVGIREFINQNPEVRNLVICRVTTSKLKVFKP